MISLSTEMKFSAGKATPGRRLLLAHLENVGALLSEAFKIADLTRLEVHGPASELDKLRGPLAHLKPAWFVRVES